MLFIYQKKFSKFCTIQPQIYPVKGVGIKISRERRATEKRPKNSKKDREIALLASSKGGGATGKRPKNSEKRPKNSTIKPVLKYVCTMYKNPGRHGVGSGERARPPCSPLPTHMYPVEFGYNGTSRGFQNMTLLTNN